MRALRRPRVVLPTLGATGKGSEKAKEQVEVKKQDPRAKLTFPDHWKEPDVRGALRAMQGLTCAYCGHTPEELPRPPVEHFRPKAKITEAPDHGGYWWLAYRFDNYVLSCARCNSGRKGNKFPMRPRGKHYPCEKRNQLHKEPRVLLDPAVDPVGSWLRYSWREAIEDGTLCELRPDTGLTSTQLCQANGTIEFFRLNRTLRLSQARAAMIDDVLDAINERDMIRAQARAMWFQPHSALARQMLAALEPSWLPAPADEVDAFIDRLDDDLEDVMHLIQQAGEDDELRRDRDEILWAMAVLWWDPPGGDRQRVETRLIQLGRLELVKPLHDRLS
ncbi:MAG: hypothetical protein ABIO70_20645 [Pseudomonadota bacterium]